MVDLSAPEAKAAPMTRTRRIELIVLLGVMTAFAPICIDMYLPAMPQIARDLKASTAEIEFTLATFFMGFAFGQAFYGPVTDRFGRKPPLYVGLIVFVLASFACALAQSAEQLIVFRLLQALGACAGVVVARACVRDLFPSEDAPRIFAAMILVLGVAPLLAPLAGGYVALWFGWPAIFWSIGGLGLLAILLVKFRLQESHGGSTRTLHPAQILRDYLHLLRDRRFSAFAFSAALSNAGMFAYITASPHVFITIYDVPYEYFGWIFGAIAAALIAASQIAAYLLRFYPAIRILFVAQICQGLSAIALLFFALTGLGGMWTILLGLICFVGFNGAINPTASGLAMAPFGRNAGMASALLGAVLFSGAAVVSFLIGSFAASSAIPMALVITVCALGGLFLTYIFAHPEKYGR